MESAVTYLREIFWNFSTWTDDIQKKKKSEQMMSRLGFNLGTFRTQAVNVAV
jgi:hypothetical protein